MFGWGDYFNLTVMGLRVMCNYSRIFWLSINLYLVHLRYYLFEKLTKKVGPPEKLNMKLAYPNLQHELLFHTVLYHYRFYIVLCI